MERQYNDVLFTFNYRFNDDGKVGHVDIVFHNFEFEEAHFPFTGTYTMRQWEILACICDEIKRLAVEVGKIKSVWDTADIATVPRGSF